MPEKGREKKWTKVDEATDKVEEMSFCLVFCKDVDFSVAASKRLVVCQN
jgi:hypothetical protein